MALAEAGAAFAAFAPTFENDVRAGVQVMVDDICAKCRVAQKEAAQSILAGSDTGFSTANSAVQGGIADMSYALTNTFQPSLDFDTYASALVGEL